MFIDTCMGPVQANDMRCGPYIRVESSAMTVLEESGSQVHTAYRLLCGGTSPARIAACSFAYPPSQAPTHPGPHTSDFTMLRFSLVRLSGGGASGIFSVPSHALISSSRKASLTSGSTSMRASSSSLTIDSAPDAVQAEHTATASKAR